MEPLAKLLTAGCRAFVVVVYVETVTDFNDAHCSQTYLWRWHELLVTEVMCLSSDQKKSSTVLIFRLCNRPKTTVIQASPSHFRSCNLLTELVTSLFKKLFIFRTLSCYWLNETLTSIVCANSLAADVLVTVQWAYHRSAFIEDDIKSYSTSKN